MTIGKAQADLLRYFRDKLEPYHQLMFSTHSPFMVPAGRLETVRTAEDRVKLVKGRATPEGTKVSAESLAKDPDTLFPLQGALGYDLTQTLFVGTHTLLVEGPSDILYLQALSAELKRRGKTGLDPKWTICPAGGIDKIQSFVATDLSNAPVATGALKAALSMKVLPASLKLKVGLIGKPINRKIFYALMLEYGRKAGGRGIKRGSAKYAAGIGATIARHFVYNAGREAIYEPFKQIWDKALARASSGVSDG